MDDKFLQVRLVRNMDYIIQSTLIINIVYQRFTFHWPPAVSLSLAPEEEGNDQN